MADTDAETREKTSAWPMFVALGLATGEVGVFLGLYPVAVGGLLLFVGSVAGIVHESGYASSPWRLLGALGGLLVLGGLWVVGTQLPGISLDAYLAAASTNDAVILRGFSIVAAGVIAIAASGAGRFVTPVANR